MIFGARMFTLFRRSNEFGKYDFNSHVISNFFG